jgi:hypothetical protein
VRRGALEREPGSVQRVAEALGFLGTITQGAGRAGDARALYRESLAAYAPAGNPAGADDVVRRLLALEPLPGSPSGEPPPMSTAASGARARS